MGYEEGAGGPMGDGWGIGRSCAAGWVGWGSYGCWGGGDGGTACPSAPPHIPLPITHLPVSSPTTTTCPPGWKSAHSPVSCVCGGGGGWGGGQDFGFRTPCAPPRTLTPYLQGQAPLQRVLLPVPQAELPVVAAGEEEAARGVSGQTPNLIRVTLRMDATAPSPHRSPPRRPFTPSPPPRPHTCTMALKPPPSVPRSSALRVVPTSSSSPAPSAMVRTAPKRSGICFTSPPLP